MSDVYRTSSPRIEDKPRSMDELLAEAKAKRADAEKTRIEAHNVAFAAAYLKKLEGADESDAFVEVEIPRVGKCLFRFPDQPQHAQFKRHLNDPNKPIEMGPCKTYAVHCAIFPEPVKFKELCEKYNVQGFETSAVAVAKAMMPKDKAEGESSATDA